MKLQTINNRLKHCLIVSVLLSFFSTTSYATDVTLQQLQTSPIQTQDAQLRINMNPQQALPPGQYTFELVVIDDSGNQSNPTQASVMVRDIVKPTAVLIAPTPVNAGSQIVLDGSKSSDIGGKVSKYIWRLLPN